MSHIIAGHFQTQDEIAGARAALQNAGFGAEDISAFYANPQGQHDVHPLGGDHDDSPGAKESSEGVVQGGSAGAVAGAVAGSAAIPVAGPLGPVVGALVGAHVGSLFSLSKMKDAGEPEEGREGDENMVPPRKSGMMIAVAVADDGQAQRALELLRGLGATALERAEGTISAGDWRDFDPTSRPVPA
jgi:hypothetical protein